MQVFIALLYNVYCNTIPSLGLDYLKESLCSVQCAVLLALPAAAASLLLHPSSFGIESSYLVVVVGEPAEVY